MSKKATGRTHLHMGVNETTSTINNFFRLNNTIMMMTDTGMIPMGQLNTSEPLSEYPTFKQDTNFKDESCKHLHTITRQIQLRSADEPSTSIKYCQNCPWHQKLDENK